jgi:hypothetical protein
MFIGVFEFWGSGAILLVPQSFSVLSAGGKIQLDLKKLFNPSKFEFDLIIF